MSSVRILRMNYVHYTDGINPLVKLFNGVVKDNCNILYMMWNLEMFKYFDDHNFRYNRTFVLTIAIVDDNIFGL